MSSERDDRDVVSGWDEGISGTVVRNGRLVHVEHIWSTVISITVPDVADRQSAAVVAIGECVRFFEKVDVSFSAFRPLSEVSLYRMGLSGPGGHTPEFEEVMVACRRLRNDTRGAFDPWCVPGGYDPSGYVKGWAAGRASEILSAAGFGDHLVNAGGDISARGDEVRASARGWPVGILNPHEPTEVIAVVDLRDEAMATSGRYERGDHVIDPSTGEAAVSVDSATVVGPDAGMADAIASAVLVHGLDSMAWFPELGADWSMHLVIDERAHSYGEAFDARLVQRGEGDA